MTSLPHQNMGSGAHQKVEMPWGSMAEETSLTGHIWGTPQCREHEEPRRTGSLRRKSNSFTMPWAGETAGYRDMYCGAWVPPHRGFLYHRLPWATYTYCTVSSLPSSLFSMLHTKVCTFQLLKLWALCRQGPCLIHLCINSAKVGYPSGNVQKVIDEWMDGQINEEANLYKMPDQLGNV